MKEFMLYIRNEKNAKASLPAEQHLAFIKKCEAYINRLKMENRIISAQPQQREGVLLSKDHNGWTTYAIDPENTVQVGYYHIIATDIDEAVLIAKENPEFEYVPGATIEVRPIRTKENETGFVYPKG